MYDGNFYEKNVIPWPNKMIYLCFQLNIQYTMNNILNKFH